jgi:hypothetical protein
LGGGNTVIFGAGANGTCCAKAIEGGERSSATANVQIGFTENTSFCDVETIP